MDTKRICPECQRPLTANALQELCPECLVKAGLGSGVSIGAETESGRPHFIAPSPEELAGKFPQLEILGFIGQGGMGAVYKARQKQLDRIVALKILPPGIGEDPAFAERFTREAKALAKLNHPGIVAIHDFGRADGLFFFVMEFVDGANLRQILQTGRVSPREALAIVPQICDALQYAHDQGVVHRDIKPENILLDRRGRVKVADFGLAKLVELGSESAAKGGRAAGSTALTKAGKILGTPNYIAPEQMEHPDEVDHRADIYALGVVLYQMLTGELPGKPLQRPSSKVHIDVRLDEIVLRALEQKPERRYQQASVLKTDVETIAGNAPITLATGKEPRSKPKPPQRITGQSRATPFLPAIIFALCYASFIGYLVYSAQWLPTRVASHFGSNLEADGWMPRQEFLLILGGVPMIFPLIFLGLAVVLHGVRASAPSAPHILRQGLWFACLFTGFLAGVQYLTIQGNNIAPARLPTGQFLFLIGGFLLASGIFVIQAIYRLATLDPPGHSIEAILREAEQTNAMSILYSDGLIEITDQKIVFRRYYLPFGGERHVPLSQIESVQIRPPSIWFGSWRIWGGGFRTWFPLDWARPSRDAIFFAFVRGGFTRIGFTVEDSKMVSEILKERGLLPKDSG